MRSKKKKFNRRHIRKTLKNKKLKRNSKKLNRNLLKNIKRNSRKCKQRGGASDDLLNKVRFTNIEIPYFNSHKKKKN